MNDFCSVDECVSALQRKGAVALVPTETVYGLVCRWEDEQARNRIYQLKHRAENKPFAAFVRSVKELPQKILPLPRTAELFAEKLCPGPVTIIVPDHDGKTFGFRIPDHPLILELLEKSGGALASTSANLSGHPPALCPQEALRTIDGPVDAVLDGGSLPEDSKASTVILVNGDSSWKILREGPVPETRLRELCRTLEA